VAGANVFPPGSETQPSPELYRSEGAAHESGGSISFADFTIGY